MTTTGWPPGMLQDDSRELSRWLANRPGALYQLSRTAMNTEDKLREALEQIANFSDVEMGDGDGARKVALEALAATSSPGAVSEDIQRFAIEVEKMLCAKLGREWRPSGMSIESLVEALAPAAPSEPVAQYTVAGFINDPYGCTIHDDDAPGRTAVYFREDAPQPSAKPSGCSLGCTSECKAKQHGCASECPALPWQPSAKPAGAGEQAAALKQLIGSQVNYPHTPRSKAWFTEVCAAVDALATPPAAHAGLTDAASLQGMLEAWELSCTDILGGSSGDPWSNDGREAQCVANGMQTCIDDLRKYLASTPAPVMAVAPEAGGFVRLSKHSDHGKPYRAFTHAQEQARAELAPAIAALIVRDVCETDPADPADPNTVSVNVDVLSEIVSSSLTAPPAAQGAPVKTVAPGAETRYRWLRDKANWDVLPVDNGDDIAEWRCVFHSPYGMHDEAEDNLDKAIDSAMTSASHAAQCAAGAKPAGVDFGDDSFRRAAPPADQGAPVMAEAPPVPYPGGLAEELHLVLVDPDSSLSDGARRALDFAIHALRIGAITAATLKGQT